MPHVTRLDTEGLDEAANVCRRQELPNLYSHYGSGGIALMSDITQLHGVGTEIAPCQL